MTVELPKTFDPKAVQEPVHRRWMEARAFSARPDARERRFVVMMPLPNVTGALHMGHAMDNVMQDLLVRWHRMMGENTLWMPGTDHAGIATQAVVEKRILEQEGKSRHELGREELVRRIWAWKHSYEERIVRQQQAMGCSCDWERHRFTMDPVCTRAVRHTFFRMFQEGLVYRGLRLVNWDCFLRTAVADDEVYHQKVQGCFWRLRYPVVDPAPGEPQSVEVATTRPETMLGDTAVAVHPDPKGALSAAAEEVRRKMGAAPAREREELEARLADIEERKATILPRLERLAAMARAGRLVRLPLLDRPIPLILDPWARPDMGTGCVKITPGHDPNDYEVWLRHRDRIGILCILAPDGTLNEHTGPYAGLDRAEARRRVLADLEAEGWLAGKEDRELEVGHSDRSKTVVEPLLSRQWFVAMGDVEGGILCGKGTPKEHRAAGLAQAAMDAARKDWSSPSGRRVSFWPDGERYTGQYLAWLAEKRDWCISRQLWWGHRIPIWAGAFDAEGLRALEPRLETLTSREGAAVRRESGEGGATEVLVCLRDETLEEEFAAVLEQAGLHRDPDVLDTWFSSALWPHSTLGWPDPETAEVGESKAPLKSQDGQPDALSYYYPGSCLVTGRDIITLWVARMVMMGLYNLGDVPFTDVFLHATIQDGKGERMSKSKGNGIDPVDIIQRYGADAMRYVLCEMQTGTQDIRLPVQAVSPFTGNLVDLATAERGRSAFAYVCPESGREFDVLGSSRDLPPATLVSDRFDVGRNFCNKLWNAARFVLMNLEGAAFAERRAPDLAREERWILSRLAAACAAVDAGLSAYNPSAALAAARSFFRDELCDWYLELAKPALRDPTRAPVVRQVLAAALDHVLRLLHPFLPFVTEALWEKLGELAPARGIETRLPAPPLLLHAPWPAPPAAWRDVDLEARFDRVREAVRAIRDVRARHAVPPARRLAAAARAQGPAAEVLREWSRSVEAMAGLAPGSFRVDHEAAWEPGSAPALAGEVEVLVLGVVDPAKERERLSTQERKLAGQIEGLRRRLEDAAFLAKAPAAVVERDRRKLGELEAQRAGVQGHLARLP